MSRWRVVDTETGAVEEFDAENIERAQAIAKEWITFGVELEPTDETTWLHFALQEAVPAYEVVENESAYWRKEVEQAREMVERGDQTEKVWVERGDYRIAIDPPVPPCTDSRGHDWRHESVTGHGGGVIETERCSRCGWRKITDTWAQDPVDGTQGLVSYSYSPPRPDDEAG